MQDYGIRSLEKKLELKAGFLTGTERFTLKVDRGSDGSWWNYTRLAIHLGVKWIAKKDILVLSELLMKHEVGHVLHTERRLNTNPAHFQIVNILEDARIESLMRADFAPLHKAAYKKYYCNLKAGIKAVRSDPYNIGVLLRWRKSGVETETDRPDLLGQLQYEVFLNDWAQAISAGIEADNTYEVIKEAESLYRKWRHLFDKFASDKAAPGSTELTPNDLKGAGGEPAGDEIGAPHDDDDSPEAAEAEDGRYFNEKAWFDWDRDYIETQSNLLKRLLQIKGRSEKVFAGTGRRFDARRIDNPPMPPFKTTAADKKSLRLKKALIVVDGSGSMEGKPFGDAAHIAHILSMVFPVDIIITTTGSPAAPIPIPIEQIDLLRRFCAWGSGENYRSVGDSAIGYSFTIFLTDARVDEDDKQFVEKKLSKLTKLGAGYVGDGEHRLTEVFHRNFYSDCLDQNVARMIALFFKRYMTFAG